MLAMISPKTAVIDANITWKQFSDAIARSTKSDIRELIENDSVSDYIQVTGKNGNSIYFPIALPAIMTWSALIRMTMILMKVAGRSQVTRAQVTV